MDDSKNFVYVCRVLPNTVCVQVDDIKKAIQSLEGKIRTLTPEPMVHTHTGMCTLIMLPCTQLCTLHPGITVHHTHAYVHTNNTHTHTHTLFMLMNKQLQNHYTSLFCSSIQIGAHGKPVVFLHPKDCDGVLVELEEA